MLFAAQLLRVLDIHSFESVLVSDEDQKMGGQSTCQLFGKLRGQIGLGNEKLIL